MIIKGSKGSEAVLKQERARESTLLRHSLAALLCIDPLHHLLDVLADDIRLDVEDAAGLLFAEVRDLARVWDQRDREVFFRDGGDRQADAVEGGGRVNFSLLRAGLVDKVYAFIAPKLIGGSEALTPVEGAGFAALKDCVELSGIQVEEMAGDILLTAYTRH